VGVEVYSHSFLKSALDGGEWLTSRPDGFTPTKDPGYLFDIRMGVPQRSEGSGEKKNVLLLSGFEPSSPQHSRYIYWALPASEGLRKTIKTSE
jgi:hypothetical protein